jgi:hypothetical protein
MARYKMPKGKPSNPPIPPYLIQAVKRKGKVMGKPMKGMK